MAFIDRQMASILREKVRLRRNNKQLNLLEGVEGRLLTEGNTPQSPAVRTLSRGAASRGLWRVRQAAKRDSHLRFTALFHHLSPELLAESFYQLERDAAPGIDGVTWQGYKANLGRTCGHCMLVSTRVATE